MRFPLLTGSLLVLAAAVLFWQATRNQVTAAEQRHSIALQHRAREATHAGRAPEAPRPAVSAAPAAPTRPAAASPAGLQVKRAEAFLTYGRLATDLHLTAEQQNAFFDACATFSQTSADLGTSLSDPVALDNARRDAEHAFMQELQGILGASGVAAYDDYQREVPLLREVQQLASISPDPLTDAQGNQLEAILKNNSFGPTGELGSPFTQWDNVLAQAKDVLTDAQYDAFVTSHATAEASKTLFAKARASLAARAK